MLFWSSKIPLKVKWSPSNRMGVSLQFKEELILNFIGPLDKLLFFLTLVLYSRQLSLNWKENYLQVKEYSTGVVRLFSKCPLGQQVSTLFGNLLEMSLRPHPKPTIPETLGWGSRISSLTCMSSDSDVWLKFESPCFVYSVYLLVIKLLWFHHPLRVLVSAFHAHLAMGRFCTLVLYSI